MQDLSKPDRVDLVVNTFERTYRRTLVPGFFPELESRSLFRFEKRVVLINNVDDPRDARQRAEDLIQREEIDEAHLVSDLLDRALETTKLHRSDLGRVRHYTDAPLVAVTLPGSDWIVYWDPDVRLLEPGDWVTRARDLMEMDPRILVANPRWPGGTLDRESLEVTVGFSLGYGFSDQVFLARRRELARPIYRHRCVASWRYPMAHIAPTFEARVDAYMRKHRRLRATCRDVAYEHTSHPGAHPRALGLGEKLRRWRNRRVVRWLRRSRSKNPCWRIDFGPGEEPPDPSAR